MRYLKRSIIPLIIAAFTVLLAACNNDVPKAGAVIEGDLTGLPQEDTIVARLAHVEDGTGRNILMDTLRDGRFCFIIDSLPDCSVSNKFTIFLTGQHDGIPTYYGDFSNLYLEPKAKVRISGEGKWFRTAKAESPVRDQKLQQEFISKMSKEDLHQFQELSVRRTNAYWYIDYISRTGKALDANEMDSLQAIIQNDLSTVQAIEQHKFATQAMDILESLDDNDFGQFALHELNAVAWRVSQGRDDLRERCKRMFDRLNDEQKNSYDGRHISSFLKTVKPRYAGDQYPDFTYKDMDGAECFISNLKGKWVLVDFWGLGCHPCKEAIPELRQVSEDYKDMGVVVVSIGTDSEKAWKEGSEKHNITWLNWIDPQGRMNSLRAFNGQAQLPVFVLVGPDGVIKSIHSGYREGSLHKLLDEAMK